MHELVHGKQLDRGDARDRGGSRSRPDARARRRCRASASGISRVPGGEALHVDLVDHRFVQRYRGRAVVAPVEERVVHDALRHVRRAVVVVARLVVAEVVPEASRAPVDLTVDRLGVRVEQELGRVAAHARGRVPRTVHAVAVALTGADGGEVRVPAVRVDLFDRNHASRRRRRRTGTARPARRPRRTARSSCPRRRRSHPAVRAVPARSQASRSSGSPPCTASSSNATRRAASGCDSSSSSGTGSANDQFGRSPSAPGILGRCGSPTASSSVSASSTDGARAND